MQIVNIDEEAVMCGQCNKSIALGNFSYVRDYTQDARSKQELCTCNQCKTEFILQYDFFNPEGHINPYVFSGDVNDTSYNWQDQLTLEQQNEIGDHLKTCKACNEKLVHEMTTEAWLASLIHSKKK